jgi:glycosyltransferase involved in cell wall biosynthesis
VTALLRHGGMDIQYIFNLLRVPADQVMLAIRAGSGTFLRADFERKAADDYDFPDPASRFLYPSVKGAGSGLFRLEASTVHDLSTLFMPENHEETNIAYHLDSLTEELATDDVVFCVSEATRAALTAAYPSVAPKARLLYQYVDWPREFEAMERNMPPFRIGRYAAVVGTIEPRKNLGLLIRALSMPEIARSNMKFVVIGRKGWLVDQFLADLPPETRERLIFSGFVSEFTKYRLIKGAEFLVLPSIYEGFGIPALEAMSLGKPVLGARTSSFPEVIGDAGVYFDPLSPSEFAAAFDEINDPRKIAELSPKAISQNATFGWERMAAPIMEWTSG